MILVGHDMGLLAQFVDRLGVMYAGKLVEVGPVREIFQEPLHPYTQLLIASLPSLEEKGVFRGVPGLAPSLLDPPTGCLFHPRCPHAMDRVHDRDPRSSRRCARTTGLPAICIERSIAVARGELRTNQATHRQ